jgi:ubiquinone/menaquinone biosynthesis C-methylase UbiE
MTQRHDLVCPVTLAGALDSRIRRWLQNPRRLLEPHVREGMTALDFGCGPGFFTLELARLVGSSGRVLAVDLQPGMLERVRAKTRGTVLEPRITLHQCQATSIGVSTPVDFALAFYVLHELPDPAAFLTELRQLLAARGQLLVVEPPLHVSRAAFDATLRVAQQAGLRLVARPRVRFNKAALLAPG